LAYQHRHYEPNKSTELTKMQQRAKAYQIIGDELYKTSVIGPLLRCLSRDEGKELFTQIHSSVCGGHIGARAHTTKMFRQGFYWPSIICPRWVPMLGSIAEGYRTQREKRKCSNEKTKSDTECKANCYFSPMLLRIARAGLFIVAGPGSYYNASNTPNHLPRQ
jgi:hypothetical protein